MKFCWIFLLIFFSFSSWSLNFYQKSLSQEELIQKLLEEMTVEEKIGQLFMLGYLDVEPDEYILKEIRQGRVGNVKVFGWNAAETEPVAEAVAKMQKAAAETRFQIPLFVATDQEGGWVRHIKGKSSITPGNNAIGATNKLFDAYESGRLIAAELRLLGINMNFAPVVDLFDDPKADLIGPRTFSSDPEACSQLGVAFFHGQESSRVLSTAKHFPGHGRTGVDSHITMPRINITLNQLRNHELIPFRVLAKEKIPAIMSGHLNFPQITGGNLSASLSPFILKNILRDELQYKGLVITDDLLMGGAQKPGIGYPRIIAECIRAGNDIVLISKDYKYYRDAFNDILNLYQTDESFQKEVHRGVENILRAKIDYLQGEDRVPLYPTRRDAARLPLKDSQNYQQSLALRAISISRKITPLSKNTPILVAGSYVNLSKAAEAIFENSQFFFIQDFSRGTNQYEITDEIIKILQREKRTLVLLVSDVETAAVASVLNQRGIQHTIFSSLNPFLARNSAQPDQPILYLYGVGFQSFKAAFSALAGDYTPTGRLPLK